MGRYIGPKNKVARRFYDKIFGKDFVKKYDKEKSRLFHKRTSRKTEYGNLLMSKKKLLLTYNIREQNLLSLLAKASLKKENLEDVLISYIESRLDNVVFRLGFGRTRKACRQLVSHKHIMVNGQVINIASYLVKKGDVITFKGKDIKNKNICDFTDCDMGIYKWLTFDKEKKCGEVVGIPQKEDVPEKIKWTDIIEIYSR